MNSPKIATVKSAVTLPEPQLLASVPVSPSSSCNTPTPIILRVAVGSRNPAKIRSVKQALQRLIYHNRDHDLKQQEEEAHASSEGHSSTGFSPASNGTTDRAYTTDTNSLNGMMTKESSPTVALQIEGIDVESGVNDQPFGDDETLTGAKNRARAAYRAYRRAFGKNPHLAIGLEGGLEWTMTTQMVSADDSATSDDTKLNTSKTGQKKQLFCMAWMAIYGKRESFTVDIFASKFNISAYHGDKKPIFGMAKTASFAMPDPITKLIVEEELELGDADDMVFGREKGKNGSGTVGILTNGAIDRSGYYEHAIMLAMAPWIRPDVYADL